MPKEFTDQYLLGSTPAEIQRLHAQGAFFGQAVTHSPVPRSLVTLRRSGTAPRPRVPAPGRLREQAFCLPDEAGNAGNGIYVKPQDPGNCPVA